MGVLTGTFNHKGVLVVGEKWADVAQPMVVHLAIEVDEVGVHCAPLAVNDGDAPISAVVERMSDDGYARPFEAYMEKSRDGIQRI